MKRFVPPLLACLLASPAFGGGTSLLFDDGNWRIVGTDAGAMPLPIAVTRDKAALGSFSALAFFYDRGSGLVPVLNLLADGTTQPIVPPPGVPGAIAQLNRYFDCETGLLTGPLRFAALELPKKTSNDSLKLKGALSNFDSLVSDKLKILVLKPTSDRMRVEFQYKLKTQRDICIDQARHDTQEEFRIVQVDSRFISPSDQLSDLARYVKNVNIDCNIFGDCDLDKTSFCAPLANVAGYVLDSPERLHDHDIELFHTSNVPDPTPTLEVEMFSPSPNSVKPQGYVTETSEPDVLNVSFWADWVEVKKQYDAGKTVGTFVFAIEAQEPRTPGCDRTQD